MEDLDVKVREVKIYEEAVECVIGCGRCCCKASGNDCYRWEGSEKQPWLEAGMRDRDAAIAFRGNDCGDDECHGLAATLGAWLPGRCGAQTSQAQARLEEGGWRAHLPDHGRERRQVWISPLEAPFILNAMPRVKIGQATPDRETIDVEVARLRDLDVGALRARWHTVFGRRAPPHLPRHLLFRVLAYRLQADHLGDLDDENQRLLDRSGSPEQAGQRAVDQSRRRPMDLRPGTVLGREWNGQMQRVAVLADGFAWNGKTYPSLSKVALAITGTRWNGPRFFGMRDKRSKGRPSP
jgi:hypothetical protein